MTFLEAIRRANGLRPNDIPDAVKAEWLYALEAEFAELHGVPVPQNPFPDPFPDDGELLTPYPYDECYPLFLAVRIDAANEETALWQNDAAFADDAIARAKAFWRRTHLPEHKDRWRGL